MPPIPTDTTTCPDGSALRPVVRHAVSGTMSQEREPYASCVNYYANGVSQASALLELRFGTPSLDDETRRCLIEPRQRSERVNPSACWTPRRAKPDRFSWIASYSTLTLRRSIGSSRRWILHPSRIRAYVGCSQGQRPGNTGDLTGCDSRGSSE